MEHRDQSLSTRDLASPNPTPEAPDAMTEGGSTAAEGRSPVENAEGDALTPKGDESVREPRAAGEIGHEPAVSGESRPQADTDAPGQVSAAPAAGTGPAASDSQPRSANGADGNGTLLPNEMSDDFRVRWENIQTQFVDEPRGAVQDADKLVATVMQKLAEGFAQERERLEAHWDQGEDISTEDLRVALRRYRSFFQRLLSA
jgi:hypothetical protein